MILDLNDRTVLLVEDNPGDARLIAESLRDAGSRMRLVTVDTLAVALLTLASEQIDAVILDLGLPDSQGLDTFAQIQAAAPDIATLILSGDSDNRTALSAVQEGAQDFLIKGHADGETLVRSIGYAIERKKAEEDLRVSEEHLRHSLEVAESLAEFSRVLVAARQSIKEIAVLCLDYALALTVSDYGYVSHIDQETGANVILAATSMMPGAPAAIDPGSMSSPGSLPESGRYPHLWGVSLNTARTFFTNSPATEPDSTGVPEGHMPLTSFLSVPVATGAGLVGQIAVANALEGYSAESTAVVERLAWLYAVAIVNVQEHDALMRSEQDLRTAQATARIGSFVWDIGVGTWTSSETMDDIFGIDASFRRDFDGWLTLVHADDRDVAARYVTEEVLAKGQPFDLVYRLTRHADGRTVWAHGYGTLEKDPDGTPRRLVGVIQDITPQHAAEEEILTSNDSLQHMIRDVAEVMGSIIETRDPYTQGHQVRVAEIAGSLAVEMGLAGDMLDCIEMASLLHDIGKLSVPAEILSKPGQLSDVEFSLIKEHSQRGHDILERIAFPWPIADIVLQHHERCDGSGYPQGLSGDAILLPASVIAVADVLEAMASFRPYRPSLGADAAMAEITGQPDKYCPEVVAAAVSLHERGGLGI